MTPKQIHTLFNTLRALLFGASTDTSLLNDGDIFTLAVSRLAFLLSQDDYFAWRDVAKEPPPLRVDVLFANDTQTWVGQAREVTYASGPDDADTEIGYFYDGELSGGDPPVVWAYLRVRSNPVDHQEIAPFTTTEPTP